MGISQTLSTMPTLTVMKPVGSDGSQRLLFFLVHLIGLNNATIDHLVLVLQIMPSPSEKAKAPKYQGQNGQKY